MGQQSRHRACYRMGQVWTRCSADTTCDARLGDTYRVIQNETLSRVLTKWCGCAYRYPFWGTPTALRCTQSAAHLGNINELKLPRVRDGVNVLAILHRFRVLEEEHHPESFRRDNLFMGEFIHGSATQSSMRSARWPAASTRGWRFDVGFQITAVVFCSSSLPRRPVEVCQ